MDMAQDVQSTPCIASAAGWPQATREELVHISWYWLLAQAIQLEVPFSRTPEAQAPRQEIDCSDLIVAAAIESKWPWHAVLGRIWDKVTGSTASPCQLLIKLCPKCMLHFTCGISEAGSLLSQV